MEDPYGLEYVSLALPDGQVRLQLALLQTP